MIHNNGLMGLLWGSVWKRYRWQGSLNVRYYTEESKQIAASLSYGLESCLPTAASHAVVSLCRSLKMVPYMAASKPEKSSVSLGLVSTGSKSFNSINMIDGS